MNNFNSVGIVKKFEGKKVKIGKAGSKEYFEGILDFCDVIGNLHLLTENGSIVVQRQSWSFVSTDPDQPKNKEDLNAK